MDGSSEPDIIRIRRPVIDEREDGIYMYFHDLPPPSSTTPSTSETTTSAPTRTHPNNDSRQARYSSAWRLFMGIHVIMWKYLEIFSLIIFLI